VRILVQVTDTTMLRHFTDVMLALADRDHDVHVASSEGRADLPPPAALKDHPRISFMSCPERRGDEWAEWLPALRAIRDYLRYLEPRFAAAGKLRSRARRKAVAATLGGEHVAAQCPRCSTTLEGDALMRMLLPDEARRILDGNLAFLDATVPSDGGIQAFLREQDPDLVMVTPLVKFGTVQADYVKSAAALGIPVAFPVFSWDNLSTKGLVHAMPDRVLVWNDRQRDEAVEMHGVPAERVVVTGAPRFDRFFAMTVHTSRDQFCAAHGLDASRPIVTYLCSSQFVAAREREFVSRWIDEISGHPALASANIVIRPHPREKGQWKWFRASRPNVAVTPPVSISTDQTLFDTLFHSAAVVGLNTSAQLEAGIVGRPVFTMLAPDFAEGQQGTLHFEYLLKGHGGFVELAADFAEHARQLASAVTGEYDCSAIRPFVEHFLRPHGRDLPVTPIVVHALETLAASRRKRARWWPPRLRGSAARVSR
jgi:hypothetical protein